MKRDAACRHALDELSAYIDGCARAPERIARHLAQCPDCARRHVELLKLGAHLRALPDPAPVPDFADRVFARINAAQTAVPRADRARNWRAAAVAAAAAFALAAGAWWSAQGPSPESLVAESRARFGAEPQIREALAAFDAQTLDRMIYDENLLGLFWEAPSLSPDETDWVLAHAFGDALPELNGASAGLDAHGGLWDDDGMAFIETVFAQ